MSRVASPAALRSAGIAFLLTFFPAVAAADDDRPNAVYELDPVVVTATRSPQRLSDVPANVTVLEAADLRLSASSRLDDVLRQVPGFSLLRQGSSVVSSPGIQGVSLRGLGPTNTGRTLVLLDGVPLNDPFSGSVAWSRIPLGSVDRIEVVRGGGSTIWGNLALGGVIHILTRKPEGRSLRFTGQSGGRETQNFELFATEKAGPVAISAGGSYFDTEGYRLWREDQLGEIDRPANLQNETFLGRLEYRTSKRARIYFNGDYAAERRKKGTPLGRSGMITRGYTGGGEFTTASRGKFSLDLFTMSRSSDNFTTAVSADRSSERPSGFEYKAPSLTYGSNLMWSKQATESHHVSAGLDHRWVRGEIYSLGGYRSSAGLFTTEKHVDGKLQMVGPYIQDIYRPSERWQVVAGARLDIVQSFDASDVLVDLATGDVLASSDYRDEAKTTVNPSLGLVHHLNDRVSIRSSAYRAFRAPTISELYEGFIGRDGTVTVGNADLEPEQLIGGEVGADFRPAHSWTAKVTGYWNEVDNTVTQHTIALADPDIDTVVPP